MQLFNPLTWQTPLLVTIAALAVIVFCRAGATYLIGRGIAGGTARTRWRRVLDSSHYATAHRWLERWGAPVVTLCFLTVGIQTMVHLCAGVMRMSWRRYLPALIVGSLIWGLMYGTIGFVGWVALTRLWDYSPGLAIGLGVAAVAGLVLFVWRRRQQRRDEELEPVASETTG